MTVPAIRVLRHNSGSHRWEMVRRPPDSGLCAHVRDYCGYVERAAAPVRRRELPSRDVGLIISFGPTIKVFDPRGPSRSENARASFLAPLHGSYAITEFGGDQHGVEVRFTPLGAYMFLGLPMSALTDLVVDLEDVIGEEARRLSERLYEAPGWESRFDILDGFIEARLTDARAPAPSVAWAWRELNATGGRVPVGALTDALGCSRKHLICQFREQIGLPPKLVARIIRFDRAVRLLQRDDGSRFAEIAYACGYFDQAHLNRDFSEFAGSTPTEFMAQRLPAGGGLAAG